jgi:glycogen debranching enzyme
MSSPSHSTAEWLEADGLGGFASGTIDGIRTRRYHALLLTADAQRASRIVLVNGLDVWLETPEGSFPLSSQRYAPDVVHPDGAQQTASFGPDPWPHWVLELSDGIRIEHGLFV